MPRPNHNIGTAAPQPGDKRRMLNFDPIKCPYCGEIHPPGTVWITRLYTEQGWFTEFPADDCTNEPLPPAPPPPKFSGTAEELQQRSDHAFGFDHKPYEF